MAAGTSASDKDQKVIDYVVEVFKWYRRLRTPIDDRVRRSLKAYKGWDDEYERYKRLYNNMGWRSTLYFPMVYSNIETLTPKIAMAVMGEPNFFELMPTEESDISSVDPFETIIRKQWADGNYFDHGLGHIQNNLLAGFSWSKMGHRYEEAERMVTRPRINLMGLRMGRKRELKKVPIINRPEIEVLGPERIYWDDSVSCPERCAVLIDRYFMSKYEVDANMGEAGIGWKNGGDIDYGGTQELEDDLEQTRRELYEDGQDTSGSMTDSTKAPHLQRCEILEAYGLDEDGNKRQMMVVANRKVLLFDDDNPHPNGDPPLIYTKNSSLTGRFTGSSEAEYVLPFNLMVNRLRNLHIDNATLSVNGMWKVSTFADVDLNQLVSRPWGVVETNDMEGIQPLERPALTQDALIESRNLEQDVQLFSGVLDFIKGNPGMGAPDTATGIAKLSSAANARFAARIISVQNNLITKVIQKMIQYDLENLGDSVAVRIAGKEGIKYTKFNPDNVHGMFDIIVKNANELVDKAIMQQQVLQVYNLTRGDPQVDQRYLKTLLFSKFVPGAEGKLLMPESEELSPDEENLIISQGGLVVPLPNEDVNEHVRSHLQFIQEHEGEIPDSIMKLFQEHIQMHMKIQMSIYQPLGGPMATQPGQLKMGPMGNGGGPQYGEAVNTADMMSAQGGRNVTQRPA